MNDFERELQAARTSVESARSGLLSLIGGLSDDDLARGRRGHWTVGGVLDHVVQSDWYYVRLIHQLRELPFEAPAGAENQVESLATVTDALSTSRDAILAASDGVDEETFYKLGGGHQQYSILSVLENVAMHDEEHSAQIAEITGRPGD